MNSRRPIIWMLVVGVTLICGLSLVPYSLTLKRWERGAVATFVKPSDEKEGTERVAVAAATPSTVEPDFDVATWYAERGEAPETHGVLIENWSGSHVYAAHNAEEVFNPASLIKLSTSLAALKKMGADYRFQTKVYADGEVDGAGTLRGRLYIIGNDPTFGDIGAALIGKELSARGIKQVEDAINVSPDFCFNFSESPEESAGRLAKVLRLGKPQTGIATEPVGHPLFTFSSYPLHDVLLYMNARSSNFVAERVGALVGGPAGIQQFLIDELHLPPDKVTIERASGREHNRLTPRGLLAVIRALSEEAKRQGHELSDIMPVASDDAGTLRRRLAGTGLEGAVVGKTGTLTSEVDGGMASLAGIVYTQEGEPIVFAILDQGNRIWENRQMEDQLLAEVLTSKTVPRTIASPTPRRLLPSDDLLIEPTAGENADRKLLKYTDQKVKKL